MKGKITIYTDGAARGNPGKAGWAAVILAPSSSGHSPLRKGEKEGVIELGGHVPYATNNQMELRAAIEALKYLKSTARLNLAVKIIADSKYVVLGITEWIQDWLVRGWKNAQKKPVLNRELWEELYALDQEIKPKWDYVRGHGTDEYNNRADEIATSFADNVPIKLRS